jgi:hydrogenase maturation protease
MSVLVLGAGSPFGDDRIGWEVMAALQAALQDAPPGRVHTRACDRPGASLVNELEGVHHLIIVDAARIAGAPAGQLNWLDEAGLEGGGSVSTHGFGVAQALALARAIGRAPARVDVLAISVEQLEGHGLSEPVRKAVPGAVREILARISESARTKA